MLGPVLFTLYTTPLCTIISSFDINHHLYVDDTQIYMSLSVSNAKESLEKLQHCVMAVLAWIAGSKLKLDPSKTELHRDKFPKKISCLILSQDTNPCSSAKNDLVVEFDSSLIFHPEHVGHASIISLICVEFEKSVLRSCQANCSGTYQ